MAAEVADSVLEKVWDEILAPERGMNAFVQVAGFR